MSTLVLSPHPVDAERLRAGIHATLDRIDAYEARGAELPDNDPLWLELQAWIGALLATFCVGAVVVSERGIGVVTAVDPEAGALRIVHEHGGGVRGGIAAVHFRWREPRRIVSVPPAADSHRWQDRQRAVRAALRAGGGQ